MRRKLLTQKALIKLSSQVALGVPVARALTNLSITMSRPAAVKLLEAYNNITDHPNIQASLFPEWMDSSGPDIQEQPDNFSYNGYFPLGEWVADNENNSTLY